MTRTCREGSGIDRTLRLMPPSPQTSKQMISISPALVESTRTTIRCHPCSTVERTKHFDAFNVIQCLSVSVRQHPSMSQPLGKPLQLTNAKCTGCLRVDSCIEAQARRIASPCLLLAGVHQSSFHDFGIDASIRSNRVVRTIIPPSQVVMCHRGRRRSSCHVPTDRPLSVAQA